MKKVEYPPCPLCAGKHPSWVCMVFKEKSPTQKAKFCGEKKICFSCHQADHTFCNCPKARECTTSESESTHNVLLHGADRILLLERKKTSLLPKKLRRKNQLRLVPHQCRSLKIFSSLLIEVYHLSRKPITRSFYVIPRAITPNFSQAWPSV